MVMYSFLQDREEIAVVASPCTLHARPQKPVTQKEKRQVGRQADRPQGNGTHICIGNPQKRKYPSMRSNRDTMPL